jgi:hypothetical protein
VLISHLFYSRRDRASFPIPHSPSTTTHHPSISMAAAVSFSTLPAELRLLVADYLFEQPHDAAFETSPDGRLQLDHAYSSSSHLRPLLASRQFYKEFQTIAYNKTTFVVRNPEPHDCVARLPPHLLRQVRKLVLCHSDQVTLWQQYPFNAQGLHLETLVLISSPAFPHHDLASLLHRLRHVQTLMVVADQDTAKFGLKFQRMVGLLLKNDHHQRYDAPGAPHMEHNWWEWSFNATRLSFVLRALPPKPALAEEDYMRLIKPHVDALMQDMVQASDAA